MGLDQALLALAPGGLTEMGLVALHHVVRILLVLHLARLAARFPPDCR